MNFSEFKKQHEKMPVAHHPHKVTDKPVVSVCVMTYQHRNYIKSCLDGILMQKTDFAFEILLGEDASTDGTGEICIEYAERFPEKIRLFFHHRENNISFGGNPTGRFNLFYNLYNAQGKYIAICEGDDYWTDPYKLQKQYLILSNNSNNYAMCFHNVKIYKDSYFENFDHPLLRFKKDVNLLDVLCHSPVPTVSVMFNFQFLPEEWSNYSNFPVFDKLLYTLLLKDGKKAYYMDETMAVYRIHSNGIYNRNDLITNQFNKIIFSDLLVENNLVPKDKVDLINKQPFNKLIKAFSVTTLSQIRKYNNQAKRILLMSLSYPKVFMTLHFYKALVKFCLSFFRA